MDGRDRITGDKIGAVLFAAAITNRPFLEELAPIGKPDENDCSDVQLCLVGKWECPWRGEIEITKQNLKEMLTNWEQGIRDTEGAATKAMFTKSPTRGPQHTPPKGGNTMDDKRIRELCKLSDTEAITDDHRTQALAELERQLSEAKGQVQTLTATQTKPGTVQLSEAEVGTLRTQAHAGAEADRRLKLMEADKAVGDAMSAGKILPAQAAWAKTYALNDPTGFAAYITATPKVMDFSVRGSDGVPGEGGNQNEVQAFIEGRTKGDGAVTFTEATDEAYKKFTKPQMDTWRFKKVS